MKNGLNIQLNITLQQLCQLISALAIIQNYDIKQFWISMYSYALLQ